VPQPRVLMSGIALGESPRWHDGRLWFADWGTREVVAVDLDGNHEVIVRFPGGAAAGPLCFDRLPDGRLLLVSSDEQRLLRREPDGSLLTHAELGGLSPWPWNDIVVDGRGNAYVNNINHEFGGEFAPGFVVLVTTDGQVRRVADGLGFPNGMAVTPDNATLIVAESYANRLTAFDIGPQGELLNQRVWADLADGVPDGICLDADDAVWYADVPNQRCVRVRHGGQVLDAVELDRGCFACMLGGPQRSTLFMLANEWPAVMNVDWPRTGQVLTVEVSIPGAGWP
jgi:sugar lactone lactonase YvrE